MTGIHFGGMYGVGPKPSGRFVTNCLNLTAQEINHVANRVDMPVDIVSMGNSTLVFTQEDVNHPALQALKTQQAALNDAAKALAETTVAKRLSELSNEAQMRRQPMPKLIRQKGGWLDLGPLNGYQFLDGLGVKAYLKALFTKKELPKDKKQEQARLQTEWKDLYEANVAPIHDARDVAALALLAEMSNWHQDNHQFLSDLRRGFRDVATGELKPGIQETAEQS